MVEYKIKWIKQTVSIQFALLSQFLSMATIAMKKYCNRIEINYESTYAGGDVGIQFWCNW